MSKQIKKQIKRTIALSSLKFFCAILHFLPKSWVYTFAGVVARIGYFVAVRHRRIARDSLNIAFGGQKSRAEIKKIIKDCFTNMAKGALEMLISIDKPQVLDKMVIVKGRENLDKAFSKGKGVIMVSGHFGNFPLLLTKLAITGYKVNVIVRKMRDEKADEYFDRKRTVLGVKSIYSHPRSLCVKNSIAALRNNELVFILMDQNFGTGGVFVDFFGRKAATAVGSVVFALRTEAPIIPAFIVRNTDSDRRHTNNNTHQLIIEPEVSLEYRDDKDNMIQANIAKITRIIESYIRQYPSEWGWIHRRWKSQPANIEN